MTRIASITRHWSPVKMWLSEPTVLVMDILVGTNMDGVYSNLQKLSEIENHFEELRKKRSPKKSYDCQSIFSSIQELLSQYFIQLTQLDQGQSSDEQNNQNDNNYSKKKKHKNQTRKFQKKLIDVFVMNISWYSLDAVHHGHTNLILQILLLTASLYPQYFTIFLSCLLRILHSLLQPHQILESFLRCNLFLTTLRNLLNRFSFLSNQLLENFLYKEYQKEILNFFSSSQEIFLNRIFMILTSLKIIFMTFSTLNLISTLNILWSTLQNYPNFHSQINESLQYKKFCSIYKTNLTVFFHIAQKFGNSFSNDTNEAEGSKQSLLWGLEMTEAYTLADLILENPNLDSTISSCSSFIPPLIQTLPTVMIGVDQIPLKETPKSQEECLQWVLSEYRSWILLTSTASHISTLFWRRVYSWTLHSTHSINQLLTKQLHSQMLTLLLQMNDPHTSPTVLQDQSVNFLKPILLIAFQSSPERFFPFVIRSWIAIIERSLSHLFPLTSFPSIETDSSRELPTISEPISDLHLLLSSCHLLTTFICHTHLPSSSLTILTVQQLSSLLLTLVTAFRSFLFENHSLTCLNEKQIDSRDDDCVLLLSSFLHSISYLSNHLAYILIHRYQQLSSQLTNHPTLTELIFTLFDSFSDTTDAHRSSNHSYFLPLLNPFLRSYLIALILPSFGLSLDQYLPQQYCSEDEDEEKKEKEIKLSTLLSRYPFAAIPNPYLRSLDLSCFPSFMTNPDWVEFYQGIVVQWLASASSSYPNLQLILSSQRSLDLYSQQFQDIIESHLSLHDVVDDDEEDISTVTHLPSSSSHRHQHQQKLLPLLSCFNSYDICVLIMEYVSVKRICRLACVNKSFYSASQCNELWKHKYCERWSILFEKESCKGVEKKRESGKAKQEEKGKAVNIHCPSCYPLKTKTNKVTKQKPCSSSHLIHNWAQLYKVSK
jgi:hypothetical protein